MTTLPRSPRIPLPKSWPKRVRSAMLHVVSLAQYATVYTRSWAANSANARVRLQVELQKAEQDAALLRAEMRIKDARMTSIAPHRRPQYQPAERMAILEVRAARGWTLKQTAAAFLIAPATIAAWMDRIDEPGSDALVQLRAPVNKFPEFVRYAVQELKTHCPLLGKKKIAEVLARAGLHLGATTIGRMRKEPRPPAAPPMEPLALRRGPVPTTQGEGKTGHENSRETAAQGGKRKQVVTAKRPNHVWHVDLTALPTQLGMWCSWLPWALPQSWPFCWWVAIVMDHFSRRIMGTAVYFQLPNAIAVRAFLGTAMRTAGVTPKYLISDKGCQFWPCAGYKAWCRRRGIQPRLPGVIGKHGSIAVVERLIKTLKYEGLFWPLGPRSADAIMRRLLSVVVTWHNEHRPHATLNGRTPNEVYFRRFPANRKPRFEPRTRWPRGSPCASALRGSLEASPARDSNCMSTATTATRICRSSRSAAWRRRLTQGRRAAPAPTVRAHRVVADIFNCKLSNNDVQPAALGDHCGPTRTMSCPSSLLIFRIFSKQNSLD